MQITFNYKRNRAEKQEKVSSGSSQCRMKVKVCSLTSEDVLHGMLFR